MCGRYTLANPEDLHERFETTNALDDLTPHYNIAPGQAMPVVTRNSPNRLEIMRWGLVPVWATDIRIGYRMINARAETVREKPAFRSSFKSRRCLVPISGYYEWKKEGANKQPYYYRLKKEALITLAGLTAQWYDDHGNELQTFTIITTAANSLASEVHDRMPVILTKKDEDIWLDPLTPLPVAEQLLKPFDPDRMESFPVSSDVGNPRNNTSSLINSL